MNALTHSEPTKKTMPRDVLMEEHRVIERVLDALERMLAQDGIDEPFLKKAMVFFQNFADRCHHAKEEDFFFPALERAGIPYVGGPIGCMLNEHTQGRRLVQAMAANLDRGAQGESSAIDTIRTAAADYIALLREHIQKEDDILFVMADQVLDAKTQATILAQFRDAEKSGCDHEKHGSYLALADELSHWEFAPSVDKELL